MDLDAYRRGPSTNDMGRMFGATRFMAPEELERGAPIDQRTTVFTLGRLVWHFGTRLTERRDHFCGPPALAAAVRAACDFDRAMRPPTVAAFAAAWRATRSAGRATGLSRSTRSRPFLAFAPPVSGASTRRRSERDGPAGALP